MVKHSNKPLLRVQYLATLLALATALQSVVNAQPTSQNQLTTYLDSPDFKQVEQSMRGQLDGAISRTLESKTAKDVFNDLRYGKHHVRNGERGEIVIAAAINLQRQIDAQNNLRIIVDFANRDYAEAQNILGFYHEYGLHGYARDLKKAAQFYGSAAQKGYSPAILNLALISLYGKDGSKSNPSQSLKLLAKAQSSGSELSGRICGLGAFVANRIDKSQVVPFAQNCPSRLAKMALAANRQDMTLGERIEDLKGAYSLGVMDGLHIIVSITSKHETPQATLQNCRYKFVIDALTGRPSTNPVCNGDPATKAFVAMEAQSLEKQRQSAGIHLSWAVPYLPFPATDEAWFSKDISGKGSR